MKNRSFCLTGLVLVALATAVCLAATAAPAATHEEEVRRILTLLSAVGEEYREGVRDGTVVRPIEYDEARTFLDEAQQRLQTVAAPLPAEVQAAGDMIRQAIDSKSAAASVATQLAALRQRVAAITGVTEQVYPPAPPSAARGKELFGAYCTPCHGERGDGSGPRAAQLKPPPANFTNAQFIRSETPYDFFHVISLGKTNSAMPAWDEALSLQDRWDLVSHVWTLAPTPAGLAEGQGIYLTHCAGCHGASGNGHGSFADVLIKKAPDLSQPQTLAQRSDADLFAVITAGISATPMPSFAHTLSDDERWKAVGFLRLLSLGGPQTPSSAAGADGAPAAGRLGGLLRMLTRTYERAGTTGDSAAADYAEAAALAQSVSERSAALAQTIDPSNAELAAQMRQSGAAIRDCVTRHDPPAILTAAIATLSEALVAAPPIAVPAAGATAATIANDVEPALNESTRLIAAAVAAAARGDADAASLASDAYFEFEPLETRLGAVDPALKVRVEEHFLRLRQRLRTSGDDTATRQLAVAIGADFTAVRSALRPHASASGLFIESAGIILREGFEMVLVIGALIAWVVKTGGTGMKRAIHVGVGLGVLASLATALIMGEVRHAYPGSAEVLEGGTMLLAAVVLFWVSYWLISKTEADKWQRYIRGKVQRAVSSRSGVALAGAAFLAVYREGFEMVLFYQALFASAPGATAVLTSGIVAGGIVLLIVYVLFRRFQVQIPMQQFFLVTGVFLYTMAAIFAGQGVHELQEISVIGTTPIEWAPTIPLLGMYPSIESLGAQLLFVVLLLYATAVMVRRRRAAADVPTDLTAELRALRAALDGLRHDLATNTSSAAPIVALSDRVERVLQQVEAEGAPARASGGGRHRG